MRHFHQDTIALLAKPLLLGVLLLWPTVNIHAQKYKEFLHWADSILSIRYQKADIDTNYIVRPKTKWTVKGKLNLSGARLRVVGMEDDHRFMSDMSADYKSTISAGVSYMGISLNMALNPAKMMGRYNDYELNINSYGKKMGFDFIYQNAHNFKGWHDYEGNERIYLSTNLLKLETLNINAYYAFNHRRFSYPAAFAQSYIQKRSAGSFLLAVSGQGQTGTFDDDYSIKFKMTNIGIGAGYGYNYVPHRRWLLHLSALPTFIVYSNTSLTLDDNKVPLDYHFPEVIITGRGAIVRQIGNMFAGLTMVYTFTNIGDEHVLSVQNNKWRMRAFFGFRL